MAKNSAKWIETGYNLLAINGPEGVHIETIARILAANKSSFYHFFGTLEIFYDELMLHHYNKIDLALNDCKIARSLDPEYLEQVLKHRDAFMVQVQLSRHKNIPLFSKAFLLVNQKIDQSVLPVWNKHLGVFDNDNLSLLCLSFVRDTFYSRISFETFTYEFLHDIAVEAKKIVEEIREGKISLRKFDPQDVSKDVTKRFPSQTKNDKD
jgi:AcrR family transcriptional regulator